MQLFRYWRRQEKKITRRLCPQSALFQTKHFQLLVGIVNVMNDTEMFSVHNDAAFCFFKDMKSLFHAHVIRHN